MPSKIKLVKERFGRLGEERLHHPDGADRAPQQARGSRSPLLWLQNMVRFVLLPQGYPDSVSSDYLEYQLWDTLQAFCSYLSGTLTTKAIMQGVGVGDAAATPLAATLTWILRDGTGMVGRIVFASWKGPELDTNCKKWRLAADVLNDLAMSLELCSPLLPSSWFSFILCLATSIKAIVGVAGGATRAALTKHQAQQGNMADVAAKDGSQETLVNLVASNIGVFVLPLITTEVQTWILFSVLTCLHLYSNYKAVCCLNIPILNEQRFNILCLKGIENLQSPKEVNAKEPVFLGQNSHNKVNGWNIKLGASLSSLPDVAWQQIEDAASLCPDYLVLVSWATQTIAVVFRKGANPDALKAHFNALHLAKILRDNSSVQKNVTDAFQFTQQNFENFKTEATQKGWLMNQHQLLVDEWVANWTDKKDK